MIYYFAYGSNMFTHRFKNRVPSAEVAGTKCLSGYDLRWHKVSNKDGSGKCDIFRTGNTEDLVRGVLYRIDRNHVHLLDKAEGCGNGYRRIILNHGFNNSHIKVFSYTATKIDYDLLPFNWYKMYVLQGAKNHDLPEPYISKISLVPSKKDPDRDRAQKHFKVLSS
ncbi:MAG TPA: gamma-glutamylcyclotransferase family protein [Balneolaceae bacterium]|nr:gamma-glutamylcyclotransferase family protein [Balneolaceae bacterium]